MPTPVSLPENVNVIEVDEVLSLLSIVWLLPSVADFIEVTGDIVSTVQLNKAGDGLVFPTLSLENIFKLCVPSVSVLNSSGLVQVTKLELSILHSK